MSDLDKRIAQTRERHGGADAVDGHFDCRAFECELADERDRYREALEQARCPRCGEWARDFPTIREALAAPNPSETGAE